MHQVETCACRRINRHELFSGIGCQCLVGGQAGVLGKVAVRLRGTAGQGGQQRESYDLVHGLFTPLNGHAILRVADSGNQDGLVENGIDDEAVALDAVVDHHGFVVREQTAFFANDQ